MRRNMPCACGNRSGPGLHYTNECYGTSPAPEPAKVMAYSCDICGRRMRATPCEHSPDYVPAKAEQERDAALAELARVKVAVDKLEHPPEANGYWMDGWRALHEQLRNALRGDKERT